MAIGSSAWLPSPSALDDVSPSLGPGSSVTFAEGHGWGTPTLVTLPQAVMHLSLPPDGCPTPSGGVTLLTGPLSVLSACTLVLARPD